MSSSSDINYGGPAVRRIAMEQPWSWLAAGWRDLWRHPEIGLGYGLLVALAGGLITAALLYLDSLPMVLPLAAGFMLVGPMLAVGLYETSRRLEAGEPVHVRAVVLVATRAPLQLGFIGVVLTFFMLVWVRIATLLFALFFGLTAYPPLNEWVQVLLFTPSGLTFLAVGTLCGGVLALLAYAISVVSVPMLMVRDVDAITAMLTSARAVRNNPGPMLLWAWLILLLTAFGIVTLFVGLIFTFPLVGHAAWHAYRAVVADAD